MLLIRILMIFFCGERSIIMGDCTNAGNASCGFLLVLYEWSLISSILLGHLWFYHERKPGFREWPKQVIWGYMVLF